MTDDFDAIVAGLDLEEPEDVLRVDQLDDLELVRRFNQVRQELLKSGEMHKDLQQTGQSTQAGRDLHSERTALMVEMARRGLR